MRLPDTNTQQAERFLCVSIGGLFESDSPKFESRRGPAADLILHILRGSRAYASRFAHGGGGSMLLTGLPAGKDAPPLHVASFIAPVGGCCGRPDSATADE